VVREARSLSSGPLGSESSLVSQHPNPSLVDTMAMLMKSSIDTTHVFGSDASLDHVVSHPIQPTVEEVVVPMQSSVDPTLLLESDKSKEVTLSMQSSVNSTLLLEGDASFDHVLNISSLVPSEQGSIPLFPSTLPPSPRMVSFDWNDIVDEGSYASILSSLAWQVLGSPKLVSAICELITFDRSLAQET
jgi:hypothetical protein